MKFLTLSLLTSSASISLTLSLPSPSLRSTSSHSMPTSTPSPWLLLLPRRQRQRLLRPTRRPRWSDSPAAAGAPPTPPWLTLAETSMKSGLHSRFKPLFEAAWLVLSTLIPLFRSSCFLQYFNPNSHFPKKKIQYFS